MAEDLGDLKADDQIPVVEDDSDGEANVDVVD